MKIILSLIGIPLLISTMWEPILSLLSDSNVIRTHNHLVWKQNLDHLAKLAKWLWVLICTVHFTVCYYHVMYEFQSKSRIYNLPECQGTPCSTQVPYLKFKWQKRDLNPQPLSLRKLTLSHLAKLTQCLSCFVSTYLYGAFDCMLLLCHLCVSEWIQTLYFGWMSRNSLLGAGAISEV